MTGILEKLWNGQIQPYRENGEHDPEIQNIEELIKSNQAKLQEVLGENAVTLDILMDNWDEYCYLVALEAFSRGFSLGGKLFARALTDEE